MVFDSPTSSLDLRHLLQNAVQCVFPYCSICTELHCRMHCCQIQTNNPFVILSTVPTSRVTVNVTFSALKTSNVCAEDNCRKYKQLQRTCAQLGCSLPYNTHL